MHLVMTPEVSRIRLYNEIGGYEHRAPYVGVLTVSHLTDTIAYLHGALGIADRQVWDSLLALLRDKGIRTVMMERRGTMKTIQLYKAESP
mgnify:CR=1 FL=1